MTSMEDPNEYQQIKLLTNPIKSVTCTHVFGQNEVTSECRIFKDLLDLTQGVWSVALDSLVILNKSTEKVNAIFDLKTNLITSYKEINRIALSTSGWLGTVQVSCSAKSFQYIMNSNKTFFTVSSRPTDHFLLYFLCHEFTPVAKYELQIEIRLLFQRII